MNQLLAGSGGGSRWSGGDAGYVGVILSMRMAARRYRRRSSPADELVPGGEQVRELESEVGGVRYFWPIWILS